MNHSTFFLKRGKKIARNRRTNKIHILDYTDVFHLNSTSFRALIWPLCNAKMVLLLLFYLGQILSERGTVRVVAVPCVLQVTWVTEAIFLYYSDLSH